jgi:hypothetical protein
MVRDAAQEARLLTMRAQQHSEAKCSCEHDIFSPAEAIAIFAAHHMITIIQK